MAISNDFVTRYGILIRGDGAVSSSTGQTNSLQVNGGVAVAKNSIIGETLDVFGTLTAKNSLNVYGSTWIFNKFTVTNTAEFLSNINVYQNANIHGITTLSNTLDVFGPATFNAPVITNNEFYSYGTSTFSGPLVVNDNDIIAQGTSSIILSGNLIVNGIGYFNSSTAATSGAVGALVVSDGGAYINNNLYIAGTNFNTLTNTDNSLFVAGGAWIDKTLVVDGETIFRNNVFFNGTTTYVLSSNTVYTDNIFNLHIFKNDSSNQWEFNDGKDIGFIFHNYVDSADNDSFLGFNNETNFLEWYLKGNENNSGNFLGTQFGTFRTGSIILTNPTTSNSTDTGALIVEGGVGIYKDLYIGGNINVAGIINASIAGIVTTATNLANGTVNQLVIQTAPGQTGFIGPGNAGQLLQSNGLTNPPGFINTGNTYVGYSVWSDNLKGPISGIPYQLDTDTTKFIITGENGSLLQSNGTSATFVTTSTIMVASAVSALTALVANTSTQALTANTADKWTSLRTITLNGDLNGSVDIDGSTNVTLTATINENSVELGIDTTGSYIASGETSGWGISGSTNTESGVFLININSTSSNTGNTLVFRDEFGNFDAGNVILTSANILDNTNATSTTTGALTIVGGVGVGGNLYVGGELIAQKLIIEYTTVTTNLVVTDDVIQTTNETQSLSTTSGALIITGGAGIGGNLFVGGNINVSGTINAENAIINGSINTATNIVGGTAGQVPYQISSGLTGFYGPGLEGQILTSKGTSAPEYATTSSIFVGRSVEADKWLTIRTITLDGDLSGYVNIDGSANAIFTATVLAGGYSNTTTNISGGSTGFIPIQLNPNETAFIHAGTTGQLLESQGNTASFVDSVSITVGISNQVKTQYTTTNNNQYLTFVDSNNASATAESVYTTSSVYAIPSSGQLWATQLRQTSDKVAIGQFAGQTTQDTSAVAIGYWAGQNNQGSTTVAIGQFAGRTNQQNSSVAIGNSAGETDQQNNSVAIGVSAGNNTQGSSSVAIGRLAGEITQSNFAISIGREAGQTTQSSYTVALGYQAGQTTQGIAAVAIGNGAGNTTQGGSAVAIGSDAGSSNQANNAIAIGNLAGETSQKNESISIGYTAGRSSQGLYAIAIGNQTASTNQAQDAISIGTLAGSSNQSQRGIAIGREAGQTDQGVDAIAIGYRAGSANQLANSIILNASGSAQNATNAGFYVNPIRADATSSATSTLVYYNPTSRELTTASAASISVGSAVQADTVNTVQQTSTNVHYLTFVNSNNSDATAENVYTTSSFVIVPSTGNVGLGTNPESKLHVSGDVKITGITTITNTTNASSTTTGALQVIGGVGIGGDVWVGEGVYATTKSFLINHPTKPGMKLRYGSLEGPENGVYVRGKLNGSNIIELPDYWTKLVDHESITVNLTPISRHQNLYVEEIINNTVIVKNSNLINKEIHCYYIVYAERIDVKKLDVEII